jgi:hypothetical protein
MPDGSEQVIPNPHIAHEHFHTNGRPFNLKGHWDTDIPTFSERLQDMNDRAENPRVLGTFNGHEVIHPADMDLIEWKKEDHIDEFSTADLVDGVFDDSDYGDGCIPLAQLLHTVTSNTPGAEPQMGQLDRMISESGYRGNALCSVPYHVISDGKRTWMRQEWVAWKLDIDIHNADLLVEAMKKLDFNQQMAEHAIRTISGPDRIEWHVGSERSGGKIGGQVKSGQVYMVELINCAMAIDGLIDEDSEEEQLKRQAEHEFVWDGDGYITHVDGEELDDFGWTQWNAVDDERGRMPKQNPAYRYVPIGITDRDFAPDWIEMQGKEFNAVISQINAVNDLDELGKLGYQIFNRQIKQFNKVQQGVIWTFYKCRKALLYHRVQKDFNKLLQWVGAYQTTKFGQLSKAVTKIKFEKRLVLSNEMWTMIYAVVSKRAGQVWFDRFLQRVRNYRKGGGQS